jgi:uncharacterized protein
MTSHLVVSGRPGRERSFRRDTVVTDQGGMVMAGKFVLKKGSTGKFHFNLVAGNGQVIATSEAYESKASALNGIKSVQANAPSAEIDDQTAD